MSLPAEHQPPPPTLGVGAAGADHPRGEGWGTDPRLVPTAPGAFDPYDVAEAARRLKARIPSANVPGAEKPTLAVLTAPRTPRRGLALLGALRRWCTVAAYQPGMSPPAAVLATSWDAPLLPSAANAGRLLALLHAPGDPPVETLAVGERASLGATAPPVVLRLRSGGANLHEPLARATADPFELELPDPGVDAASASPLPPFVRARWRRRLGLPEHLVVDLTRGEAAGLPPAVRRSALAACAAAVVDRASVLDALALGTPVVTDPGAAGLAGAADGDHLVVVEARAEQVAAARALAADPARAAGLSRRGRRLVEDRLDVARAAWRVAVILGLTLPPETELERMHASRRGEHRLLTALTELGTLPGARPGLRAIAAWNELASEVWA